MVFALFFLFIFAAVAAQPSVRLPDGSTILGRDDGSFLGIPYASAERWQESKLAGPLGTFNASTWGCVCPQNITAILEMPPGVKACEECLSLNIFRPANVTASQALPVFFWIHGGGLLIGSSSEIPYHGYNLVAKHDMLVVSINYRLASLGFLCLPDMTSPTRGAFGLQDQRVALQWVQRNIGAFGGDPSRVTIIGQSAGGSSVAYLLSYFPDVRKLFHRAVIMSGASVGERETLSEAFATGAVFQSNVGCASLACLQQLPWRKLLAVPFPLAGQSVYLNRSLYEQIADGQLAVDVPLIWGNTRNELAILIYQAFPQPVASSVYVASFTAYLSQFYNINATAIVDAFPCPAGEADCRPIMASVLNALYFFCPLQFTGGQMQQSWSYVFDHVPSFVHAPAGSGVPHGSELRFVFDNVAQVNATAAEQELASTLSSYLADFVMSETLDHWKPYVPSTARKVFTAPTNSSNYLVDWHGAICKTVNELLASF